MNNSYNYIDALKYLELAEKHKLLYRNISDETLKGRSINMNEKSLVSFASCSYLGLDLDNRLKEEACKMVNRYGTAFPTSRGYYKLEILHEVEELLGQMFEYPCIHTTTTSLGHVAALPILIGRKDVIIADHQVHNSVRNAFMICKGAGTHVETLRHNRMDILDCKIQELYDSYENIWFLGDGIYSMMGDAVDINGLHQLLNLYPKFRVYLDDAHGIGWCGKNGRGYVLDKFEMHPKMVLAASLGKGFGSFGGVLVCPDEETKRLLIKLGSTLIFSTPNMPAVLGASIASARIHLSDEIYELQDELQSKVNLFKNEVAMSNLLRVDNSDSPIFFFGVGKPEVGIRAMKLIQQKGFYTSIAMHPAMPVSNTGIRVTINCLHTQDQIKQFAAVMAESIEQALKENDVTKMELEKQFQKLIATQHGQGEMV